MSLRTRWLDAVLGRSVSVANVSSDDERTALDVAYEIAKRAAGRAPLYSIERVIEEPREIVA